MREFLEYKNRIEKERPQLTATPRLIAVDGIEGVGKTTIIHMLASLLRKRYGVENIVVAKVANLKGSPKQEKLSKIVGKSGLRDSVAHKFYIAGANRAYEELIVPAIDAGKIVLVDRSELDLLRYAIESGDPQMIEERKKHIQDGTVTHRLWPGHRILLSGEASDIYTNLIERHALISTGLLNLQDIGDRLKIEEAAESMIQAMKFVGNQVIIRASNKRIEDHGKKRRYLEELAERIMGKIKIDD